MRGLSQPLIANIQGLKESGKGEEVDREVSPFILNIEEKEQSDNLQWVNRELGNSPDTRSPEGLAKEEGASPGYECSCEESVEEENNLVGRDADKSMEEDENGAENSIGDVDTDEEEEGPVTVLKLSNGVMFRVPVEVQGMHYKL